MQTQPSNETTPLLIQTNQPLSDPSSSGYPAYTEDESELPINLPRRAKVAIFAAIWTVSVTFLAPSTNTNRLSVRLPEAERRFYTPVSYSVLLIAQL